MHIIDQLDGLNGKLSSSNVSRLKALFEHQDEKLWNVSKNIIISKLPIMTVDKAVKCVSSSKVAMEEVPDPFTLYRAFRYCIDKQKVYHQ